MLDFLFGHKSARALKNAVDNVLAMVAMGDGSNRVVIWPVTATVSAPILSRRWQPKASPSLTPVTSFKQLGFVKPSGRVRTARGCARL